MKNLHVNRFIGAMRHREIEAKARDNKLVEELKLKNVKDRRCREKLANSSFSLIACCKNFSFSNKNFSLQVAFFHD